MTSASSEESRRRRHIEERLRVHAFARLRPVALGTALGIVTGAGLSLSTAFLLARAALWPPPDGRVGPLLGLLGHFFPGYAVTWTGAFMGLPYGFALGFGLGALLAGLVNLNHIVYARRKERATARSTAARYPSR